MYRRLCERGRVYTTLLVDLRGYSTNDLFLFYVFSTLEVNMNQAPSQKLRFLHRQHGCPCVDDDGQHYN